MNPSFQFTFDGNSRKFKLTKFQCFHLQGFSPAKQGTLENRNTMDINQTTTVENDNETELSEKCDRLSQGKNLLEEQKQKVYELGK